MRAFPFVLTRSEQFSFLNASLFCFNKNKKHAFTFQLELTFFILTLTLYATNISQNYHLYVYMDFK